MSKIKTTLVASQSSKLKASRAEDQQLRQQTQNQPQVYRGRFVRAATELAGDSDYRASYFLMEIETFVLYELALEIQESLQDIKDCGMVEVQGFRQNGKIYVTGLKNLSALQSEDALKVKKELRAG